MIWLAYFVLFVLSAIFICFDYRKSKRVEAELREEIEKLNILYRHINIHKKS